MATVAPPPPANGSFSGSIGGRPPAQATADYKDGVSELIAMSASEFTWQVPCEGGAVVVTKSTQVAANSICPPEWANVSCSCVEGTVSATEWSFPLSKKDATPVTTAVPAAIDPSTSRIAITTIGQFSLPSSVKTLRLIGEESTTPGTYEMNLISAYDRNGGKVALVESQSVNYISEVELANIDLSGLDITEDFLPPSVTKLTLRNANIDAMMSPYVLIRWSKLASIDMSSNKLNSFFASDSLPPGQIPITTLNLSGNAFTSLPASLLDLSSLQHLNFTNNPVTNATISEELFNKLSGLQTFAFDGPIPSCTSPATLQTVHNASFCVVVKASSTSAGSLATEAPTADATSSSSTLVYVAIGGGVVIVLLLATLFTMHKRRRNEPQDKAFSRTVDVAEYSTHRRGFESLNHHNRSGGDNYRGTPLLSQLDAPLHSIGHIDAAVLNDPLIITSRLDDRELLFGDALKQGGFGTVYSGVYRRRRVAIKKIRAEYAHDAKLVESFLKEIALMASLTHPRIVEYIGCAWDTLRNLSMVTELMTRGDLREVLQYHKKRGTPLTWHEDKARFALHIAEALEYLHTLSPKVIHRDLKAKNVLVNAELDAKLTDFGISREGRFEQTHMTAAVGTSFWIAPEVLAGLRYDERADIFSFGIVLSEIDTDDYPYWNAANEPPPEQANEQRGQTQEGRILRMVLAGEMRPQFTRECPKEIRVLADMCLDGKANKRPSAKEIVEYLRPLAERH